MKPAYLNLPQNHHFDYAYLMHMLRAYRYPRDKVTQMLNRGEIIRIKKGLYVRGVEFGGKIHKQEIANVLYGPSYLSLEYVLSSYSLIPEQVIEITSVTSKRTKLFQTPIGPFSYRHINEKAFSVGVHLVHDADRRYYIASKEKALCDKIACTSNLRTLTELREYIYENLRIDQEDLKNLNINELSNIKELYCKRSIYLLYRLLSNM
jgi:predicted transcriptional regulator of viral defense system